MRLPAFLAISLAILVVLPSGASAQANTLDIQVVDGQISVYAEAVGLGRFLTMFDRVAGTESTVPAELGNRNVSVQFRNLDFGESVKKIFEGLPLDYLVLGEERIVVTAVSETLTAGAGLPTVPAPSPVPTPAPARPFAGVASGTPANPFQSPGANPAGVVSPTAPGAPVQPAVIQTPFGPLVNPRANAQPAVPGQGFPFGAQPGATNPGVPAPNGAQRGNTPSIFGNTSPPILNLNNPQPAPTDRSQP